MGKVIVMNWVTLDGVMQAPGRPDEDMRGGFAYGGWAAPYTDEVIGSKMGERMGGGFAWLFGRRSYDGLLASWNAQGGPFKDALNNTHKYVASHDPSAGLAWPNSSLLRGDVIAAVTSSSEQRQPTL
jgi:dihydrofolate reductase